MRNLFASLLCACVAFTFVGCGEKKEDAAKPADKPAATTDKDKDKAPANGEKKADEKPAEGEKK